MTKNCGGYSGGKNITNLKGGKTRKSSEKKHTLSRVTMNADYKSDGLKITILDHL